MHMDFYTLLGIRPDADEMTIRQAYKVLARRYHPDIGEGSSIEKFRQVAEAYETLIEPGRRHRYDVSLRRFPGPAVVPVEPMTSPAESFYSHELHAQALFERACYMLILSLEEDLFADHLPPWYFHEDR